MELQEQYDNEYQIDMDAFITDIEAVMARLPEGTDFEEVINFIRTQLNTHIYLNVEMEIVQDPTESTFLLLDTGLVEPKSNAPIFISLMRKGGYFEGYFVGDIKSLGRNHADKRPPLKRKIRTNVERFPVKYEKIIRKREKLHLEKVATAPEAHEPIGTPIDIETLKPQLIVSDPPEEKKLEEEKKEIFEAPVQTRDDEISRVAKAVKEILLKQVFITDAGLERFLKIIGSEVCNLKKEGNKEYAVFNSIGHAVINTGLINAYGDDIYLLYRFNAKYNTYRPYTVIKSKQQWIDNGIKREDIKELTAISFFRHESPILPRLKASEIDISWENLIHIAEERGERFPGNMGKMDMISKVHEAINRFLKMQDRTIGYAKPSFSTKTGCISWFLPLHIEKSQNEEPEMIIVLRKAEDFYEIKTVMCYDDENKDKLRAMNLYGNIW